MALTDAERARHLNPDVQRVLDPLLRERGEGRAVAFDADGTLWRGDVGEDLLRYLATHEKLPRYQNRRGVYEEYERRVKADPADAYAYCVEVMEEWDDQELLSLSADFFAQRFDGRVFPWVRGVLRALIAAGYSPWIVSASPLWPVIAGARALGVPAENVIAVDCEREGSRLTRRVIQPVPCGEGKVHHLEVRGVRPVLAVGNGDLDLPMLEYAERAIVVAPFGEENMLVREGRARGWPILRG